MKRLVSLFLPAVLIAGMGACSSSGDSGSSQPSSDFYEGPNPLTEPPLGKADSEYLSSRGKEIEITLEADIEAPAGKIFEAPAALAQYAFTALKRAPDDVSIAGPGFYAMALAEDLINADNVEWLVEGEWIPSSEARALDPDMLRHFRAVDVSTVVFNDTAQWVRENDSHEVHVPIRPFSIYDDVGDTCASEYPGISLSPDVYWFLWAPSWQCRQHTEAVQPMTVTVTKVIEKPETRYPEYDQLWEDDVLDMVIVFGVIDHGGPIEQDSNWKRADLLIEDLTSSCGEVEPCFAGFRECGTEACANDELCGQRCGSGYLGRRFVRELAQGRTARVDVFHPDLFHSVADGARFANWQRAVSEHEVVAYNGHSVLGAGIAYEQAQYPDFYQIFMVFSCLSYAYYAHPIYLGKGGWEKADIIANADLGKVDEIRPMTGHLLRGLMSGFNGGGRTSWQDIINNIGRDCHKSRPGVSGVTGNCFSPLGDLCDQEPDNPDALRLVNEESAAIEDLGTTTSVIELPEDVEVTRLGLELNISHTYAGDLSIELSKGDTSIVVWDREGGSLDVIEKSFVVEAFAGTHLAGGRFTLTIVDHEAGDAGTLNSWSLVIN